mmetsp:Transcript_52361/g.96937  ORF Transcript_52361/g.96937 Transcript_52361/m.96937 type:complete len:207 (+) Transcript_52361:60-680(+)
MGRPLSSRGSALARVCLLAAAVAAFFALPNCFVAPPSSGAAELEVNRRALLVPGVIGLMGTAASAPAVAIEVQVPEKIKSDPFELLAVDPNDKKQDKAEFYMKRNYKGDTEQLLKHMRIAGVLDKGTPNMERYNKRVKEELDDWVALYRRQDKFAGRQSFYTMYTAIETLASHYTSYGPKFPFPNKRRPRYYELLNIAEKYLDKGK